MNNEEIKNNDIFQCKMYITDLETGKDSKEIDVSDLIFKDWIEFEFGNYEDEDYGQLPYKDFKFFINDYSVTFYSPQYQKAKQEIIRLSKEVTKYDEILGERNNEVDRLNNIIDELETMINNFDVFKEFTFPLMKRDEEQQVKSSIDYEWRKSIKEPFLNKLKELKEGK